MSLLNAIRNEARYAVEQVRRGRIPYTPSITSPVGRRGSGTGRGGSGRGGSGRGGSRVSFDPRRPAPGTTVRPTNPITNPLQGIQQGFSNLQAQAGQVVRSAGQGISGLQAQAGRALSPVVNQLKSIVDPSASRGPIQFLPDESGQRRIQFLPDESGQRRIQFLPDESGQRRIQFLPDDDAVQTVRDVGKARAALATARSLGQLGYTALSSPVGWAALALGGAGAAGYYLNKNNPTSPESKQRFVDAQMPELPGINNNKVNGIPVWMQEAAGLGISQPTRGVLFNSGSATRLNGLAQQPRNNVGARASGTVTGGGSVSFNPGNSIGNTGGPSRRIHPAAYPGVAPIPQVQRSSESSGIQPIIDPSTYDLSQSVRDLFGLNLGNTTESGDQPLTVDSTGYQQQQPPRPNRQQNIPFTREDMMSAATSLTAPSQIFSSAQNQYVPFALKDYYAAQQVLGTQNMQDNLNRLGYEQANRLDLAAWAKANPRLAQQLVNRSMIGG
jgi:hypothetical protein